MAVASSGSAADVCDRLDSTLTMGTQQDAAPQDAGSADAAVRDAQIIADFAAHVNAPLAAVMKFIGFDSTEAFARGCIVTDSQGREFLDCVGGFGVMNVGHSHPRVVAAVKEQLDRMAMSSR